MRLRPGYVSQFTVKKKGSVKRDLFYGECFGRTLESLDRQKKSAKESSAKSLGHGVKVRFGRTFKITVV